VRNDKDIAMLDKAPNPTNYGLLAPQAVFWLVAKEREVWEQMIHFIGDAAPSEFDVVLPPTIQDVLEYKANPKWGYALRTVRLKMRKIKHHLTGQPMIEMTCDDDHLANIESCRVQDSFGFNIQRPEEIQMPRNGLN
jgi:hypothetical protein